MYLYITQDVDNCIIKNCKSKYPIIQLEHTTHLVVIHIIENVFCTL